MNPFYLIIGASSIIIISFLFNILAKKTNIPSVLMLIGLGMIIAWAIPQTDIQTYEFDYIHVLNIIGQVGLVMIVLEAALDLKLTAEKKTMIINSFLVALIGLLACSLAIAGVIMYLVPGVQGYYQAMLYAVPLSIMSSAIIIPSVGGLTSLKKEFMVYEGTFSDILGIMLFYFLLGSEEDTAVTNIALDVLINLGVTVLMAGVVSYGLVYIFQKLEMQVKLFLIISVLLLMYALGKTFHLSALLFIMAFGLVLNNTELFFRGPLLSKWVNQEKVKPILKDFHVITLESAFLMRTFFFVIFGMSISLATLFSWNVALVSMSIIGVIYGVRVITLLLVNRNLSRPEVYIAPRGLITVLLYFVVTSHQEGKYVIDGFDPGILLFIILVTSIVMSIALIVYRGEKVKDVLFKKTPIIKDGKDILQERIRRNVEQQGLDETGGGS